MPVRWLITRATAAAAPSGVDTPFIPANGPAALLSGKALCAIRGGPHEQAPSARLMLLPAALCMAFALSSCAGLSAPAGRNTAPSASHPATASPPVQHPSSPTPDGGSTAVALSTFSGTWEDVRYSFDHPSDWTVQDTTVGGSPGSGVVTVMGPDGRELASLTILIAWGAECPCVERPAVHLGDVAGDAPLSKSGPFVVRSMAMDLTDVPAGPRGEPMGGQRPGGDVPQLEHRPGCYSPGAAADVRTGPGGNRGGGHQRRHPPHRSVHLQPGFRDHGRSEAYAASEEHRKVQELIASFREGSASA